VINYLLSIREIIVNVTNLCIKSTVIAALLLATLLLVNAQTPDCPCVCNRNVKPVCGQKADGTTTVYSNACLMECANRCNNAGKYKWEILALVKLALAFSC
jgi:hypothetical protein